MDDGSHKHGIPPLPPLFNPTPESVLEDAKATITQTLSVWNKIVQEVTPETATIENTILPVAHNENEIKLVNDIIFLHSTTHHVKEVREASKAAHRLAEEAEIDLYLRDDMFALVNAVMGKTNEASVDPETYRFLLKHRAQFVQNGCDLQGDARAQYESDLKQLKKAIQDYKSNLDNDMSGMWLTLAELDGLPKAFIDGLKQGEGDQAGKYWVHMKRAHQSRLLKYAKSEEIRMRYFIAHANRLPDNVPLVREIMLLRDSLARQKGESSWARFKMSEKMMNSPESTTNILEEILSKVADTASRDAAELLALKKEDVGTTTGDHQEIKLFLWDIAFYENIKREKANIVDNKMIMEYFELQTVLKNILGLYERIFDIRFEPVTQEKVEGLKGGRSGDITWHENVISFLVWDVGQNQTTQSFLGSIYFDLYSRQGKFSHAGHFALQKAFIKRDGSRSYPASALVMNYSKPVGLKPCLMTIMEVRSLFHEVGHGMHNLLSITKFSRFHGTRVDRDFVETPSILFEQFLWTAKHIRDVSRHYSYVSTAFRETWLSENSPQQVLPQEDIPDDLVQFALSSRESNFNKLRQLHFAIYDMEVHNPSSREAIEQTNFCELYNKLWVKLVPAHGGEERGLGWEWGHGESCIRLIMGGNYDAGYYAYILGEVWALDIFETFFQQDTTSKEAARRYRDMILKPGGSQNEWKTLTEYLGRDPRPDAFLRQCT